MNAGATYRIRRIGLGAKAWALIVNGRFAFEGATRGECEREAALRFQWAHDECHSKAWAL